MPRPYRQNILNIEPMDTIIVLKSDLDRLVKFVQNIAKTADSDVNENSVIVLGQLIKKAQTILKEDNQLSDWQKRLIRLARLAETPSN